MNSPWPIVPIGELLERSKERVEILPHLVYKQVTVRLWGEGVVLRNEVSGTKISAKTRYVARPGQFILSRIDARNGALGLVPDKLDGAVLSNDFPVFNIDQQQLAPRFLEWMSKTKAFVALCQVGSEGTTNRVRLQLDRFMATQIPLPPLAEQRRIVARIEALVAKVEAARKLREEAIKEADALLRVTLVSIFEKVGNLSGATGSLISQEICEVVPGQHILSNDYNQNGIGEPYITGPADFGQKSPTPTKWTTVPKVFAEPGDVLLTVKGAGVGKLNCAPDFSLCIGRQVMALRPNKDCLQRDYLYYFLMNKYDYFQDVARSTTVPGLKREHIWDLEVPLLPLSEQHRIVAHLDALQAKLTTIQQHQAATQARLDALLPSILDKAFKGEL